ncbi:MAG: hypothetical protein HGA76_11390 [Candidatus Firestonebacteria bacterium]|nr:hypothetical protein [Candidatus Firestonebacteria bacterium]
MPNHIHGIIVLHDVSTATATDIVGAGFTPAQTTSPMTKMMIRKMGNRI